MLISAFVALKTAVSEDDCLLTLRGLISNYTTDKQTKTNKLNTFVSTIKENAIASCQMKDYHSLGSGRQPAPKLMM